MPGKSEETYIELFSQIRQSLEEQFGSIGIHKTVLMDFEAAAHNAIGRVFPEWTVKSCYFHFAKNVIDHAKHKDGLTSAFNDEQFVEWLNGILGKFFIGFQYYFYNFRNSFSSDSGHGSRI